MLLLGETGGGVPVQVNLQVNAQALHAKYAEMVRKLEETVHKVRLKMAMRDDRLLERRRIAKSDLTNTWQIDCHFVRFDAARCAFHELPIFVGKSPFQRVATPLGFEPRITPPKGAVLPLHHGVPGSAV